MEDERNVKSQEEKREELKEKLKREENLKREFGETVFERIECLDCGADKTEALKRYEDSEFIWVEDKPENAEVGAKLGLKSFLLNQPYNKYYNVNDNVTRVKNWKDLYEWIC